MIFIKKNSEPSGLQTLRAQAVADGCSPNEAYDRLNRDRTLKIAVKSSLIAEQGHLCAYCMCRIPRTDIDSSANIAPIILEHVEPRNPVGGGSAVQALNYNNFVAVCHGNKGPKGTRLPLDLTCDAHKENCSLKKINPCDASSLTTIKYSLDGTIFSADADVQFDLHNTLNLNYLQRKNERKAALEALIADIDSLGNSASEKDIQNYCQNKLNAFAQETDPKTPYVGILIWYLKGFTP